MVIYQSGLTGFSHALVARDWAPLFGVRIEAMIEIKYDVFHRSRFVVVVNLNAHR